MTSPSNPPFQPLTLSVDEWERLKWRVLHSDLFPTELVRECEAQAQAAADLRQRLEEAQLHHRVTRRTVESLAPALVEARERASQAEAALGEMRTMLDGFQEWLRHTSFSPHPARVAFAEALTELQRRRSAPGQEQA